MFIFTAKNIWAKVLATNSTATDWTAKPDTATEPTNDGVFSGTHNHAKLRFFGTDAANETFLFRVLSWRQDESGIWSQETLISGTVTLGTAAGIAAGDVTDSDLYADTIASVAGSTSYNVYSPADNTKAWLAVDLEGAQKVEVIFHRNSSASSCNAQICFF